MFINDFEKGEKITMGNLFKRYENKGIRIGRAEGLAEGMEKGFLTVAMEMMKRSMPAQMICELTKLSLQQLQTLSRQSGVALVMH